MNIFEIFETQLSIKIYTKTHQTAPYIFKIFLDTYASEPLN